MTFAFLLVVSGIALPLQPAAAQSVPSSPLPAPGILNDAANVLGLAQGAASEVCTTFGIPDVTQAPALLGVDAWFGEGENGEISRAKHNGVSVSPEELTAFLQRNAEQHNGHYFRYLITYLSNCYNGFAFCIVFTPGIAGTGSRAVGCAVCCGGQPGRAPYASCNASQYTAYCGCN